MQPTQQEKKKKKKKKKKAPQAASQRRYPPDLKDRISAQRVSSAFHGTVARITR
jgi:hypothetical protein